MIKRTYRTEDDCAHLWVQECFQNVDSGWITDRPDFWERFEFYGEDGETCEYGPVDPPMWSTWFEPVDALDVDWIEGHTRTVAELGFTLIYADGYFYALGIDGAGYNFYTAHWIPLYRRRGLKWHDED